MAFHMLDEPLSIASRGTLPATLLPMGVKQCTDDPLLKDQTSILGWLNLGKGLDLADCHDQKSENDEPVETQLGGDVEFHVREGPQETVRKVKYFLSKEVAEVTQDSKEPEKIDVVVFVDFAALQVEVSFWSAEDHTTVVVKDQSRNDVVRLHRFCEHLKESFAWQSEQAQQNVSHRGLQPELLPMSFDEFEDDRVDSQRMRGGAEAVLNVVTSRNVDMRVEGAQVLASWAQECPECREHIAEAMLKHDGQIVEALLQNSKVPVAEAYLLAAALRYTLLCPKAASRLSKSGTALTILAIRKCDDGSTAAIVQEELSMAAECLDRVSPQYCSDNFYQQVLCQ